MSGEPTSSTGAKNWADDDDGDDGDLRKEFASTSSPTKPLSSESTAPSLLSRLGGFAIDTPDTPDSTTPAQPVSTAEASSPRKPKVQPSGNLFGKALAGVKADRTPQPAPANTPASSSTPPSNSAAPAGQDAMRGDLADNDGGWGGRARAPPSPQASKTAKSNGDGWPTGDGWGPSGNDDSSGTNGHSASNRNGGRTDTAAPPPQSDAGMTSGSGDSGLISNAFQVEVKLADQQADPNSPLYSIKDFESLPIHPDLLKGIYACSFKKPSKIQEKALPMLLNNPPRNLIGQSQSGTGKTAAFSLDMLSRVDPAMDTPQALCICPSRELARQTQEVIDKLGQFTNIKTRLCVPGSWKRGVRLTEHILIGTPGTIVDMLSRRGQIFDEKLIRVFVLDEADEMLALQGLGDQTMRIKRMLPAGVQNVLFSATFPDAVQEYAETFAPEANKIFLRKEEITVDAIRQLYLECDGEQEKYDALLALYDCMTIGQSIVFCKRKSTADEITKRLEGDGHSVASLHGDKQSADRDVILDSFRNGSTKVLITTNVVARGIDIKQVNMVVNYDVPDLGPEGNFKPDIETYIHRIGRTGRFGRKGCAVIFVHDERSRRDVAEIQDTLGKQMKRIDATSNTDLEQLEQALKIAMKDVV